MFDVVLYQPEIPPNTGNLMRLCVNTGNRLHLIEPLGFSLDEQKVRRAGLDYRDIAPVMVHQAFAAYLRDQAPERIFAYSQRATRLYTDVEFTAGDALLFGPESVGLPDDVLNHRAITDVLRIPIAAGGRSLNLANAAAIAVYEAWRQNGFR